MHKGKRKVSCSSDSLISSILLLERKTLKNYIDEKFESSSDHRMLMSNDFHRMNVTGETCSGAYEENDDFVLLTNELTVICDGVASGENSADTARIVASVLAYIIDKKGTIDEINVELAKGASIDMIIRKLIVRLNQVVSSIGPQYGGTTLSFALKLAENKYLTLSIGDSPIVKKYANNAISYCVNSHCYFEERFVASYAKALNSAFWDQGFLTLDRTSMLARIRELRVSILKQTRQIPNIGKRNEIYAMLPLDVDSFDVQRYATNYSIQELEAGESLVLCSDGLSDNFDLQLLSFIDNDQLSA